MRGLRREADHSRVVDVKRRIEFPAAVWIPRRHLELRRVTGCKLKIVNGAVRRRVVMHGIPGHLVWLIGSRQNCVETVERRNALCRRGPAYGVHEERTQNGAKPTATVIHVSSSSNFRLTKPS